MRHRRVLGVVGIMLLIGAGGCAGGVLPGVREGEARSDSAATAAASAEPGAQDASLTEAVSTEQVGGEQSETGRSEQPATAEPASPAPGEPGQEPADAPDAEALTGGAATPTSEAPWGEAFPADSFLFIEIIEERVTKSETAGQTTSFAGEQTSYSYDEDAGTLSGTLKGEPAGNALAIVGRIVTTQIDRNKATVGQLTVLTEAGQAFGPVVVEAVSPDGSVTVMIDGETFTLGPGESVSVQTEARGDDDRLAVGSTQRTVTVTNHGYLPTEGLSVTTP